MYGTLITWTTQKFRISTKIYTETIFNLRCFTIDKIKTKDYNFTYQYNVAGSDPLLNSTNKAFLTVSHTLIKVPLVEAVATIVPCWLTAKQANSPWWAFIVTGALEVPISVLPKS